MSISRKLPALQKGFTLIELIVVVSILGILTIMLITLLNPFTQFAKSRDAQRRNTLKELKTALETYYNDNGAYPNTGSTWNSSEVGDGGAPGGVQGGEWIPGLAPTYVQSLPSDPRGGDANNGNANCLSGTKRAYLYKSNGQEYALLAHCSIEITSSLNNPNDSFYDALRPTWALKVCTGENACGAW